MKLHATLRRTLLALCLGACGSLAAQDLVYTPANPAFGGNTFNYQWLLSGATAQNGLTDPAAAQRSSFSSSSRRTTLDDFTESLNRQLLNSITRQVFDSQLTNGGGLSPGDFSIGNFEVNVVEGADGLILTITDIVNGGVTEITVPFF